MQGKVARRLAGALLGGVGAAVEHQQHLVLVAAHAVLGGKRRDAGADQLLLVVRGDDDAGLHHGSCGLALDQLAAPLVVLVAVVREHADGDAVLAVPDRPLAPAVVDDAGLVEAVAPGDVLERVLADRRPEAGGDVPLRVLARDRGAGDRAHVECLAPVLDGEVAAGGGVVGEGHVADGVDAARARCACARRPRSARRRRAGRAARRPRPSARGRRATRARPRRVAASRRGLRGSP